MRSEHFRSLLSAHGPYASIFFDDSHNTEDAAVQTDLKWRGLREELERQHAAPEIVRHLEEAVTASRPPVGVSSRLLVANADGILVDEELDTTVGAPTVRVSELPYIVPALEHGADRGAYLVVTVDHAGADVDVHRAGTSATAPTTRTIDGGSHPIHKASGAESSGYGDPQPRTEESRKKNIRATAEAVTEIVDSEDPSVVFVVGEVGSRTDFAAALPDRVADRVVQLEVGARHSGFDPQQLQQAVDQHFERVRSAAVDDVAQKFAAELGRHSGLATEGLAGVCAALREGAVETLIVGRVGDATVVSGDELTTVAPNSNVLSELGAAPVRTLRADEALPMLALSIGADLVCAPEDRSPADGVAAVLRYAPRQPAGVG
ncbi:hypothetical protein EB74_23955 [Mycobacterium sp. SWH-M5]|nr:hypothetical protein EB74_23955 [Mycobacterium sp. SWH-M5]